MPASQIALIALLAEAAAHPVYGPAAPPKPVPITVTKTPDSCDDRRPRNDREIIVCAPRTDGYRLNPDVMEAKREAKGQGNPPKSPETYRDANACASVGPFGCTGTPAINLIAVGLVAAQMARRAVTGGNVGEMFITRPQKTEYELYIEAKNRREAKEKAEAAAQISAAARAQLAKATAAQSAATATQPSATTAAP